MRPDLGQPLIGLVGQLLLLGLLGVAVGLSRWGWLVGLVYGLALCVILIHELVRHGRQSLGPADRVTLLRAVLVGGITAQVVTSLDQATAIPVLISITAVALGLDAVDGHVARRTQTASAFGARFDMEVDAFLIFVLSVYVAELLGAWVLAFGAARYLFVAASWLLPWMQTTLPYRYWRKVVAAIVGVVLAVAASDVLPLLVTTFCLGIALALLGESFGRDVWWLARQRAVTTGRHDVTQLEATARGVDVAAL